MRKVSIWILLFLLLFPTEALAHEGGTRRAPDLHPLLVLAEFVLVLRAGYRIAGGLSRLGRRKE
jgi:hypothetical protein